MYLTQMRLDRSNRQTLLALAAPSKLHGAVESAFPGPRQRNLWRIDTRGGQDYLLILSEEKPDLSQAAAQFAPPGGTWQTKDYSPLLDRIREGSRWQFRLCANPTYTKMTEKGTRGQVLAHSTVQNQIKWLRERCEDYGFSLNPEEFNVVKEKWYRFRKGASKREVTFLAVTYEGLLEVRDPERFRETLCRGMGRGKAYGAGLMTLVRAENAHG